MDDADLTDALDQAFSLRTGVVVSFDGSAGAGTVRDGADARDRWFHCTRIADGERTIEVDTLVRYRVVPGPTGLEAVDVAPT